MQVNCGGGARVYAISSAGSAEQFRCQGPTEAGISGTWYGRHAALCTGSGVVPANFFSAARQYIPDMAALLDLAGQGTVAAAASAQAP